MAIRKPVAVVLLLLAGLAVAALEFRATPRGPDLGRATVSELRQWLVRFPDDAAAHRGLGRRLADSGDLVAAFDAFARAADLAPDDAEVWSEAVAAAYRAHGLAAADALVADFLVRHPGNLAVNVARGKVFEAEGIAAGPTVAGLRHLRAAVQADPNRASAHRTLGEWYAQNGFHRRAKAHLEAAVLAEPSDARAWHQLGRLRAEDDLSGAIAAFESAVRAAPGNALARVDLASVLRTANRLDAAEARYRDALAIAPDDPVVLTELGGFLTTANPGRDRRNEAEALLRRAVSADPRRGDAWGSLGRLAWERREPDEARALLEKAVALPLSDPAPVWYALSRACVATGRRARGAFALARSETMRKARFDLGRAEELAYRDPSDPNKRLAVARAYAGHGDFVKAISQYRATLALKPADRVARRELDALTDRLTRSGRMPSMDLFEAMVAADREGL